MQPTRSKDNENFFVELYGLCIRIRVPIVGGPVPVLDDITVELGHITAAGNRFRNHREAHAYILSDVVWLLKVFDIACWL